MRHVYHPFVAEYYDQLPFVVRRRDAEFYVECARAAHGPVLELGCGTGRILLPIARAGCRITGLDLSESMLNRLRAKLAAEPEEVRERVRVVRGSMTEFDLGERFALVTIPFRPFQFLMTTMDQIACLRCIRRHLEPNGKLVFDVFHTDAARMHDPRYLKESSPYEDVKLADGRRLRLSERVAAFHRAEQRNDCEQFYTITYPDGRIERHVDAFALHYFFRYEVEHLLARTGFQVLGLYGDFDRSPLRDDSPEMIFIAAPVPESAPADSGERQPLR